MLTYFKKNKIKSIYDFINLINNEEYDKLLIKPNLGLNSNEVSISYRALGEGVLNFKEIYRSNINSFQILGILSKERKKIISVSNFETLRLIPTLLSRIETLENKISIPMEVDLSNCRHLNDFNSNSKNIEEVKKTLEHFSIRNNKKSFV